ncbi:hypothetical protein TKK_0006392 [Trichogramma kaykai]|uniref:Box C/D snoRNA protein 1 n=1 Tax=Trichogramma kaykai TaxID=54128 RepID=A0ABD2XCS1_9HYME
MSDQDCEMESAATESARNINKKLVDCEVCQANKAKYTCPKCEVRTCCLTCLNIHKKELDCDGIRDQTKFVAKDKFTDLDLLSDYRFLEGIGRSVEAMQKDPLKLSTRTGNLPPILMKLRIAAQKRGANLRFLPRHFSKHAENSTFLNFKTHELFWRLELIFPNAENSKWVINRVQDEKKLSTVLEELFNADPLKEQTEESSNNLIALQSKLKYYKGTGIPGLRALLKAEGVKKSNSRFWELDMTESLRDNFNKKTIIEFPIIYIILKDHADMFEIIESDDEEFKEVNIRKENPKRKIHDSTNLKPTIVKKKVEETNNFFFNGDLSDDEDSEQFL